MKQEITFSGFVDSFSKMGRRDQFTYNGLRALYDYIIEYEEESETIYELDVIELCCEFSEFDSFEDYTDSSGSDMGDIDELRDYTTVIEFDGIIVQNY